MMPAWWKDFDSFWFTTVLSDEMWSSASTATLSPNLTPRSVEYDENLLLQNIGMKMLRVFIIVSRKNERNIREISLNSAKKLWWKTHIKVESIFHVISRWCSWFSSFLLPSPSTWKKGAHLHSPWNSRKYMSFVSFMLANRNRWDGKSQNVKKEYIERWAKRSCK